MRIIGTCGKSTLIEHSGRTYRVGEDDGVPFVEHDDDDALPSDVLRQLISIHNMRRSPYVIYSPTQEA